MSGFFKFDPDAYQVGDALWLQVPDGWSNYSARLLKVTRKTPSGQIVAVGDRGEVRFNRHGNVVGGKETICSAEKAAELLAGKAMRDLWYQLRIAAEKMEYAARKQDLSQAEAAMTVLHDSLSRLHRTSGEGGE